ncbi:DUF3272 family protein [Streptococcus oricebi]|uniref:DUF3272 domain-containing protein n=1 Tax=Streptococcus oricebi TaxID=1547447 RepID=A0ABS5B0V0_9STRE|nr:DUF3272 family protein [Streptococcus oricebi]MBP2622457.1 DUF3272 domain-containing protein [Streptococcus oricebi]
MNRRQFFTMAFFTALQTYFFNESFMQGRYFIAIFCAFLILRNLQLSYVMGKLVDSIDKQFKDKK